MTISQSTILPLLTSTQAHTTSCKHTMHCLRLDNFARLFIIALTLIIFYLPCFIVFIYACVSCNWLILVFFYFQPLRFKTFRLQMATWYQTFRVLILSERIYQTRVSASKFHAMKDKWIIESGGLNSLERVIKHAVSWWTCHVEIIWVNRRCGVWLSQCTWCSRVFLPVSLPLQRHLRSLTLCVCV